MKDLLHPVCDLFAFLHARICQPCRNSLLHRECKDRVHRGGQISQPLQSSLQLPHRIAGAAHLQRGVFRSGLFPVYQRACAAHGSQQVTNHRLIGDQQLGGMIVVIQLIVIVFDSLQICRIGAFMEDVYKQVQPVFLKAALRVLIIHRQPEIPAA